MKEFGHNWRVINGINQDCLGNPKEKGIPCPGKRRAHAYINDHFSEITPTHAIQVYDEVVLTVRRLWNMPDVKIDGYEIVEVNLLIKFIWNEK